MDLTKLAGYFSILEIDVAWGDMDAYKHVNNAAYFRYLESARIKYLSDIGWDDDELGVLSVLGEVSARFRRAICFPDRLAVGTRPVAFPDPHRVEVEHLIVSKKVGVATYGRSVIVAVVEDKGKVEIPPRCRARMQEQLDSAKVDMAPDRGGT
jgi:acyl-CoA thioester hydrolase